MRAELPTVSILCTLLLLPTLHWQWRTRDVAILSTITWLLACNLIHVINSIVWADNVVPRVPVWCDLTTKILLGAPVAIAGACLCICQRLEFIASMRELACNGNRKRRRTIMEFALCIVIPFVYMAFHTLVQNHRFDIIEDFGCEAAIYASAPAVILVWLPPILICITSLVYSILVLIHAYSLHSGFSRHIANRSRFTQSTFTRLLSMSMLQTFLLTWFFLTTLVLSAFRPWTSFKQVHSQMSTIAVAAESDLSVQEHIRVELVFWIIPVLSVIVFVFGVMGERAQQSIKSVVKDIRIRSRSLSLPIHSEYQTSSKSSTGSTTPVPLLQSGWEDTWRSEGKRSPSPVRPKSRATSPAAIDTDASFAASTLSYLKSPTARQLQPLGLPQLTTPPAVYSDQITPSSMEFSTQRQEEFHSSPGSGYTPYRERPRHMSNGTIASSILVVGSWPEPPTVIPLSPSLSSSSSYSSLSSSSAASYLSPKHTISKLPPSPSHSPRVSPRDSLLHPYANSDNFSSRSCTPIPISPSDPAFQAPFQGPGVTIAVQPPKEVHLKRKTSLTKIRTKPVKRPIGVDKVFMTVVKETTD